MRWWKQMALAGIFLLLAIQSIRPARTNPPADPRQAIHTAVAVDPAVARVIGRSCHDCHSNSTSWPWYSGMAPVSWLIVRDVKDGRSKLNLSEWGSYDAQTRQKPWKEICKEVSEGDMPPLQYSLLHAGSKLTPSEVQAVCRWTGFSARPEQSGRRMPSNPWPQSSEMESP